MPASSSWGQIAVSKEGTYIAIARYQSSDHGGVIGHKAEEKLVHFGLLEPVILVDNKAGKTARFPFCKDKGTTTHRGILIPFCGVDGAGRIEDRFQNVLGDNAPARSARQRAEPAREHRAR